MTTSHDVAATRATINALLAAPDCAAHLGIQLDDSGICSIGHESGLDCALEVSDEDGQVYLWTPLLPASAIKPDIMQRCLEGQLFGLEAEPPRFAIDTADGNLLLWNRLAPDTLDAPGLTSALLEFFDIAMTWSQRLQSLPPTSFEDTRRLA